MDLRRHRDARSFLDTAEAWLMRAEVENNLVLSIARALAGDPGMAKEEPYFAAACDDTDVFGCAVRTPPYPLAVTRVHDRGAARLLIEDALAVYPRIDEIVGPEPTVAELARLCAAASGREARLAMRQRIHEIRRIEPMAKTPAGRLRPAEERDRDLLLPWVAGFASAVGASDKARPEDLLSDRLRSRSLFVWDDGGPVSMAGRVGRTPNGVRIAFVYTPEHLRRRGYASACVAALTRHYLDEGNQYCALYTDLANPTSNALYARIGYRPVCDFAQYRLDAER
jgi:uncharacterized protein